MQMRACMWGANGHLQCPETFYEVLAIPPVKELQYQIKGGCHGCPKCPSGTYCKHCSACVMNESTLSCQCGPDHKPVVMGIGAQYCNDETATDISFCAGELKCGACHRQAYDKSLK